MSISTSQKAHQNVGISSMVQSSLNNQPNSTTNKRSLSLQIFIILIFIHNLFISQCFASDETINRDFILQNLTTNSTNLSTLRQLLSRHKRFSLFGLDEEKAANYCSNGGKFLNGKCECKFPYTGAHCVDFACRKFTVKDFCDFNV